MARFVTQGYWSIPAARYASAALEAEVQQLAQCVDSANEAYAQAAARLEAQRQRLKECDAEIR